MNIDIIAKSENKVIGRKEFVFEIAYEKTTPRKEEVKEAIVLKTGVLPDTLVLKSINQHAGERKATVIAYAYSDADIMLTVEPKYILKRNGFIKEEKKKEEKKEETRKAPKKL
jgi:small subunit ribosomal protein S24e